MRLSRFSLRTLLVLALSVAAGGLLWRNDDPAWRVERAFTDFGGRCDRVLLSRDGKWVVGERVRHASEKTTDYHKCKVWNVESGRSVLLCPDVPLSADDTEEGYRVGHIPTEIAPNSRYVLFGFLTERLNLFKIWDMQEEKEVDLGPSPFVTKFAKFSPNGQFIMRWADQKMQLYDLYSGRKLEETSFAEGVFSADSSLLAILRSDGGIGVFDTSKWETFHIISKRANFTISKILHVSRKQIFTDWLDDDPNSPSRRQYVQSTAGLSWNDLLAMPQLLPGTLISVSPDETKGVIVNRYKYTFIDLNSFQTYTTQLTVHEDKYYWSADSELVFSKNHCSLHEAKSGNRIFAGTRSFGSPLKDFSRSVTVLGDPVYKYATIIHDMRDGKELQRIKGEYSNTSDYYPSAHFLTQNVNSDTISYWTRYRPEEWWGLIVLPEAWLLIALIGMLVWSVRRDRTYL